MATEHAATHIAIYVPVGIPELLHAEDYARALAADSGNAPAAIQARKVAAAHPHVTIQLLPLSASLHAAGGSGTFSILRFSHDPAPMLVLADGPASGTVLDNQDSVAAYDRALTELRSQALTPEESARWLRRMAGAQGCRLPVR